MVTNYFRGLESRQKRSFVYEFMDGPDTPQAPPGSPSTRADTPQAHPGSPSARADTPPAHVVANSGRAVSSIQHKCLICHEVTEERVLFSECQCSPHLMPANSVPYRVHAECMRLWFEHQPRCLVCRRLLSAVPMCGPPDSHTRENVPGSVVSAIPEIAIGPPAMPLGDSSQASSARVATRAARRSCSWAEFAPDGWFDSETAVCCCCY